ncbi:hypothetical protein Y032_0017g3454 [Ancylostoma ceylanicum]|nr:hypothetical protein Y032_0017g3454 [Ancylostoma ceylanicum]
MITLLLPIVAFFSLCHAKINANEPLSVSITPKIWNLLTTKANFINNAVTSIKFPDFDGKNTTCMIRLKMPFERKMKMWCCTSEFP